MGKEAVEIGAEEARRAPGERPPLVTRVAAHPAGMRLVAGRDDGQVWAAELETSARPVLRPSGGAAITALAVSPLGSAVLWGDAQGAAGLLPLR